MNVSVNFVECLKTRMQRMGDYVNEKKKKVSVD